CIDQNVSWLDVAMKNSVFVRVMHSARHLGDELCCLPDGNRLVFGYFIKLTTFDKLHAEIALPVPLPYLVDGNDAWMVEARSGSGFQTKALEVHFRCPLTEADDF